MKKFIKGMPDWQDDLNDNFDEVGTQLSDVAHKNGILQTSLNAEMLSGVKIDKLTQFFGSVTTFSNTIRGGIYYVNNSTDGTFPYAYGLLSIMDSGGEKSAIYQTTGDNKKIYTNVYVAGTGWTGWKQLATTDKPTEFPITGLNGFASVAGSKTTYCKTQEGIVNINAFLCSQTPQSINSKTIFNLPVGYRPNSAIRVVGYYNEGNPTELLIMSNGAVQFSSTLANVSAIFLNATFVGGN